MDKATKKARFAAFLKEPLFSVLEELEKRHRRSRSGERKEEINEKITVVVDKLLSKFANGLYGSDRFADKREDRDWSARGVFVYPINGLLFEELIPTAKQLFTDDEYSATLEFMCKKAGANKNKIANLSLAAPDYYQRCEFEFGIDPEEDYLLDTMLLMRWMVNEEELFHDTFMIASDLESWCSLNTLCQERIDDISDWESLVEAGVDTLLQIGRREDKPTQSEINDAVEFFEFNECYYNHAKTYVRKYAQQKKKKAVRKVRVKKEAA